MTDPLDSTQPTPAERALTDEIAGRRDEIVALACDLVAELRASGAVDGVHLIPVPRHREVAARLEGDAALRLRG